MLCRTPATDRRPDGHAVVVTGELLCQPRRIFGASFSPPRMLATIKPIFRHARPGRSMLPAPRSRPTSRMRRGRFPKLLRQRSEPRLSPADSERLHRCRRPRPVACRPAHRFRPILGLPAPDSEFDPGSRRRQTLGDWQSEYRRGNQDESAQRNGRSGCRDGHQRNPAQHDSPSASVTDRWKCSNKAMGEPTISGRWPRGEFDHPRSES